MSLSGPSRSLSLDAVAAALAVGPLWLGRGDLRTLFEIFTYLALAQAWNLLAGYAGIVSVGQQAFVGLGGYVLFICGIHFGIHPLVGVALAGIAASLAAAPLSIVVFRLKGPHLAIGTWVIAEVFLLAAAAWPVVGGGGGLSLPAQVVKLIAVSKTDRDLVLYFASFALAIGANTLAFFALRSRIGLALAAVRDNEDAARSLGVDSVRVKFAVFVIAAGIAGSVGALIFLAKFRISPDAAFSLIDWTAYVIFIVVVGGVGRLEGPILGVIVFFTLRSVLADLGGAYQLILGLIAIAVMLKMPRGLVSVLMDRAGIDLLPTTRRMPLVVSAARVPTPIRHSRPAARDRNGF